MAFLFLGMGLAMGVTAVALSEAERETYYVSRSMFDYLGNKDGAEIYRDKVTGEYYSDDGYEVRRYGKPGFRPHPINRERLKSLMQKYNPDNVRWVDFLLAMYCGNEVKLWENIFKKYQIPPQPKEPTWGRGIRKERWARYDEEKSEWDQKVLVAKSEFKKECEYWDGRLATYIHENQGRSGRDLLQRALSGEGNVIAVVTTTSIPSSQLFQAKVPEGMRPGDQFTVSAGGSMINVKVPPGAKPGTFIQFNVPASQASAAPLAEARYVSQSSAAASSNSTRDIPTATFSAAPPPAIGAEATSTRKSSFKGLGTTAGAGDGGWAPSESALYVSSAATDGYDAPPPAIGAPSQNKQTF